MDEETRMARSAAGILASIAAGTGLINTPLDRHEAVTGALLEATGCSFEVLDGRCVAMQGDRRVRRDGGGADMTAIVQRMREWLTCRPRTDPITLSVPAGGVEIIERSGMNLRAALLLLEVTYFVARRTGDRVLSMQRNSSRVKVEYVRERHLRWNDGIVTTRSKGMPGTMVASLTGRTLDHLIEDDLIGDRIIRRVCSCGARDGMLRIVTMDEGMRHIHAGA